MKYGGPKVSFAIGSGVAQGVYAGKNRLELASPDPERHPPRRDPEVVELRHSHATLLTLAELPGSFYVPRVGHIPIRGPKNVQLTPPMPRRLRNLRPNDLLTGEELSKEQL